MMSLPALHVRVKQRNRGITVVLVAQQMIELGRNVLTVTPWACPGNERVGSIYCGTCHFAQQDRKSTRLNSSHSGESRMPSSA